MKTGTSSFTVLAAALLAACGGSSSSGGSGTDGNDSFAAAQAVAVGSSTTSVISSSTDHDWYKFTTTGAGDVAVAITGLSADANLALLDSTQVVLAGSSNAGTAPDAVTYTAAEAGTFYVHVIPQAAAASYSMAVNFTPATVGDGNDTFATAQTVAAGSSTTGVISSMADADWYKFTTTGAGDVTVALTGLSGDANLALYDAAQAVLVGQQQRWNGSETVAYTAAGAGTFYVQVIPQAAGASYSMAVNFTPATVGDGNDTFATAQEVAFGSTTAGVISSMADADWYKVTTAGPGNITATLSGLTGDADLELYGAGVNYMVSGSYQAGTAIDTVTYNYIGATAFTFRVKVVPLASVTPYTLTVTFTP